jgi:hypothetical protein
VAAVAGVSGGGIKWIRSWPAGQRRRPVLRAGLGLVAVAVVIGGSMFAYRARLHETSRRVCAPALIAPTRAEREAALRDGKGPLFPVFEPHYSCVQLEEERRELERSGTCPEIVMDDVPCTCEAQRWTGASSSRRCPNGPTSCAPHPEPNRRNDYGSMPERVLGCAGEDSLLLREARDVK